MFYLKVLILAVLQGMCELLPVSSSAHVIVAERLMGLNPSSPEMTLLLVMLHTGTMFSVIIFFWRRWRDEFFASRDVLKRSIAQIAFATILTGIVGYALKHFIEKVVLGHIPDAEIELLFGRLDMIAAALTAVGMLIVYAGWRSRRTTNLKYIGTGEALVIGAVQGVCLPFRGFSRSGATISTGLLLGIDRVKAETFSFALAVVVTPPVIVRYVLRLLRGKEAVSDLNQLLPLFLPSAVGMVAAFIAGILALRWLSSWLEHGRWIYFGYYCFAFAGFVFFLHLNGY